MIYPWHADSWHRLCGAIAENRVPHAWVINGPPYTGKSQLVQQLGRALLCEQPHKQGACGECRSCRLSAQGSHPDFLHITVPEEKQEIGVGAVREMTGQAMLTRQLANYKVIIIEPLEAMNLSAASALLKTLEEPPAGTVFIAISHRRSVVLPTIMSRCQRVDLPGPSNARALQWLRVQTTRQDIEDLLEAAEGLPLRALQLSEDANQLALRSNLRRDLSALIRGQLAPLDAAKVWSKTSIEETVAWMLSLSQNLIRRCASDPKAAPGLDVQILYPILDQVIEAKRALAQRANLNSTLMLETLAVAWATVARRKH